VHGNDPPKLCHVGIGLQGCSKCPLDPPQPSRIMQFARPQKAIIAKRTLSALVYIRNLLILIGFLHFKSWHADCTMYLAKILLKESSIGGNWK
jgi:hypothetical protein